ncbi:hypothetical protein yc1106_05410 [Curvularia clavata]|uniref:Uncharacterized protein n=1 Tax=Curvularia clavata TaxID=95742 RepID=A0A9Q8Z9D5_CURCL|nr:hypothetical protein yc1106_05410 [Curvularia clavata]
MLPTSLRAAALALLWASVSTAETVSLASFIPRIDNLPTACNTVYFSTIAGCVPTDFAQGATCSVACVRGLAQIADRVKRECADVDAGELSIIGVFQNELGIPSLCPGIAVTTISSDYPTTSTRASSTSTSTKASSITTSFTNSAIEASSTPASSSSAKKTEAQSSSSSSSSTSGLVMDPNATGSTPTMTVAVPPEDTSRPEPTLAPGTQLSNAFSGGGSPFDIVATGSSSQQEIFGSAALALLATTLILVICA